MKEDYSYLIIKYLENSLSKEDRDAFYLWVNSDKKNKKLFFEVKTVYDAAVSEHKDIDIENSWQRLLKKKIAEKKGHTRNLWANIASYAAVVTLAVCITSAVFFHNREDPELVASCYIGGDGLDADVVILPDGTKISLGSKTKFYYDPVYGQVQRNVYLEGEAYFEVSQNKDKPFIVNIDGMKIEAVGTNFNVMAYPEDSLFTTTLLEGSIRLTMEYNAQQTVLKPNQQFVYNKNSQHAKINNVDAKDYIIWTSGYYYFYEQTLESIFHRLNYVYGITTEIKSEQLKNTKFTGTFYRGQSVKNIMEIINLSVPIKYAIKEHNVTVSE